MFVGPNSQRPSWNREDRLSFQVRIKQLEDVSLARSCQRLHHHACPAIASAAEDLFPVATRVLPPVATDKKNQPRSKPWSHS